MKHSEAGKVLQLYQRKFHYSKRNISNVRAIYMFSAIYHVIFNSGEDVYCGECLSLLYSDGL